MAVGFFTPNSLIGLTSLGVITIFIVQVFTMRQSLKNINDKYKKLSYVIFIYSFAAALIMYGLALYYFTAFPNSLPLFAILATILLSGVQMVSAFMTQWKIANIREYVSGGLDKNTPLYKFNSMIFAIVITLISVVLISVFSLKYGNNLTRHIEPQLIFLATIPIIVTLSIYSSGQMFVNLKNLTNLYP